MDQSVAYATLSAPDQVQEELEGLRDLTLNDFESFLGEPWLKYYFNYQPYMNEWMNEALFNLGIDEVD